MKLPSEGTLPSPRRSRALASAFDFIFLMGVLAFYSAARTFLAGSKGGTVWSPELHVYFPLALLPFSSFLCHRLFGTTVGQYLLGIEWKMPNGGRARNLYEWLFLLELRPAAREPQPAQRILVFTALLTFALGASAYLGMNDLSIRPFTRAELPLFAPDVKDPRWIALPFFYATGAIPFQVGAETENLVEFGLPYERGPPNRFLGKLTIYWRGLDSRLTYTGPLTLPHPEDQVTLAGCFTHWLRCTGIRRKLWKATFSPFFEGKPLDRTQWFVVPNSFLPDEERAQGIYLRSRPDRGRIREAYFLVGPKMAIQGILLDRPDREEGEAASTTLTQMIGSTRLTGDLSAPRAFINPKLARLKVGPDTKLPELIAAEGHLLAKVSIEPKEAESFYHLGGLGITLFRRAKKEGRIELAASSKTIVKSAVTYLKDIDPESKHLPEMERFGLEVQ